MKLIRTPHYQELSMKAAAIIIKTIQTNPTAVLGLATGSTPTGTYERLIKDHVENGTSYKDIRTINLDEYVGLPTEDINSYRSFMERKLFSAIDINPKNTYLPNGNAVDIQDECARYDQLIQSIGGIDLQLLGIGENGHIGFNEPGTPFTETTHVVELTHNTRKANARFFKNIKDVPTQAITMGIKNILESKAILLLASGENKAEAMARLLTSHKTTESFPASSLFQHQNVTVIADEAALSLVDDSKRSAF
ncbi:glucosamine-6-phosphate deaminase [Pullulanibacillus pueri]|uniref:Glucosamine-6-phosphate deaminase n=1 Tax=Pullulanibacillus pueri TaxID=1437324 RepID=A0A8J2ZVV1_9BACL|nr:glucosamine-6-phosphate deaminase [Pullulanibacillus pueri]MBM7682288.1 glucosamine-6-phosphate deaminase [Pullulanibacillus pueri]GGH80934.1 glucosamine-6-phosphate deaminase 1 [Pullulanibacillus pueri]